MKTGLPTPPTGFLADASRSETGDHARQPAGDLWCSCPGLSVALRAAALADIGDVVHAGLALIAAHAVSRAVLPAVMRALTPARAEGLGVTAGTPGCRLLSRRA